MVGGDALLLCRSVCVHHVKETITMLTAQLEQQQRRQCVVDGEMQANGDNSGHVRAAVLPTVCDNFAAAQNNSKGGALVTVVGRCGGCLSAVGMSCCTYMLPLPQFCVLIILGAAS